MRKMFLFRLNPKRVQTQTEEMRFRKGVDYNLYRLQRWIALSVTYSHLCLQDLWKIRRTTFNKKNKIKTPV